jgi:hypothetical protein
MFPTELERAAFRASNGEFAWTRAQIPAVVDVLRSNGIGILGGELWWVRDGFTGWDGLIPQRNGSPALYTWETKHEPGELWPDFIERGASDALVAVKRWPMADDLPPDLPGRVLYNLTWTSEEEFQALTTESSIGG